MQIKVWGPSLSCYHNDYVAWAFSLWSNTTNRRVNESKRKKYKPREKKSKFQRMDNKFLDDFLSDSTEDSE